MRPRCNPRLEIIAVLLAAILASAPQMQAGRTKSRNPEHFSAYSSGADFSATWYGPDGNWSNGARWSTAPAYPNNSPQGTYDIMISNGTVTLDRNITIQKLYLTGGIINGGAFNLTLNDGLDWSGGGLSLTGTINLAAGSISNISGSVFFSGPTLNNSGTVVQSADITNGAKVLGTINNLPGATWNTNYDLPEAVTFNNAGSFAAVDCWVEGPFNNTGSVTIESNFVPGPPSYWYSGLTIGEGGTASGSFYVGENAALTFFPMGYASYTFTAGATINGPGMVINYGGLDVTGNTTINSAFRSESGPLVVEPGAILTFNDYSSFLSTHILLQGSTINSPNTPLGFYKNSSLEGYGTINGDISFGQANFTPPATATLRINGNVYFSINDYLFMQIGGNPGNGSSYFSVAGNIFLGGGQSGDCVLFLSVANNFESQLKPSDIFTIAHADGTIFGELAGIGPNYYSGLYYFGYLPNGQRIYAGAASFQVNYGPSSPYSANDVVLSRPIIYPTPPPLTGLNFPADAGMIMAPFVANGGNVSQQTETDNPSLGGRASYLFNVTTPGEYTVAGLVDAPGEGNNSFFISVDSEPTTPTAIWDIVSLTNGPEWRTACWRGTGTFNAPQIVPKRFDLSAGVHELVIRGREVNTILKRIRIDPGYLMAITSYTKNFDGSITLSWLGKTGRSYYVKRSGDPTFPYGGEYASSEISGTEPQCHFTIPASNLVGVQREFYRVELEPPP